MASEKELKIFEQAMLVWLFFAAVILVVWGLTFVLTKYVLTFFVEPPLWRISVVLATVLTVGVTIIIQKLLLK